MDRKVHGANQRKLGDLLLAVRCGLEAPSFVVVAFDDIPDYVVFISKLSRTFYGAKRAKLNGTPVASAGPKRNFSANLAALGQATVLSVNSTSLRPEASYLRR
jgi:hypothetical protein